MTIRSLVAAVRFGFMLLLVVGIGAEAAEVRVLSVHGMRAVMEDLGPKFERATGHKLAITFVTLGAAVKRVQDGETADVVVIPRQGIDGFVKDGEAAAGNVTVIARSSIGVAVRNGAPKPDISSPEALKRTLLAAKSITYPNPAHGAASGIHFAKMLDRLGIADEMKSKTVFLPKAGPVGVLVANGEAEIAVHQLQELIPVAGIEIVGPLPGDLQDTLVFAAAIMGGAKDAAASKALVGFLRTPEAAAAIKAKGMEPATPAQAAELRILGNIGFQAVMEDLAPRFERATGHKLAMTFGTVGAVIKRIQAGEAFDVVIVTQSGIEGFVKDGKVAPGNVSTVAFSRSGVAVRKGAPKPDISSAEALKRSLLAARSITYSDPATGAVSGVHFAKVLDRMGIADEMKPKTLFHPKPGFAVLLVANGQADIVVQPFQELVPVDGIEIVGPLPSDLQQTVVIAAAIVAAARDMEASKALVDFLRAPDATAVIKAKGLDPAGP